MKFDIRNDIPVVTVSLITYNHQRFIRECLDSLLMQQTRFPYEICIGEDGSSDGTREICREYAARHPEKIRLFEWSRTAAGRRNYMSQGVYNYIETARASRGRYLALCDGDDAWMDPQKLQKQYAVMEANPAVALVHSDYEQVDEISGRRFSRVNRHRHFQLRANPDKSLFRYDIIQRRYPIAASTVFVRTADVLDIFDQNEELFKELPMGDTPTWSELIEYGSFHYIDEALGLYRICAESESNSQSPEKKYRFVNAAANLGLMLGEKRELPMKLVRADKIKNCNRHTLLSGDRTEICRLHSRREYIFSFPENLIYHASRISLLRALLRELFRLKFRLNNHRRSPTV